MLASGDTAAEALASAAYYRVFALLDDLCLANNRISDRGCSTLLGVLLAPPAVQQV